MTQPINVLTHRREAHQKAEYAPVPVSDDEKEDSKQHVAREHDPGRAESAF